MSKPNTALKKQTGYVMQISYTIVLYLRLFSSMGDKTHPFTIGLYDRPIRYNYAKS